jgi:hypothetical protein
MVKLALQEARGSGPMLQVEIHIREQVDEDWSDWLAGVRVVHAGSDETVLTGPMRDQAALRGLLDRLADLGLQLVSVATASDEQSEATAPGGGGPA